MFDSILQKMAKSLDATLSLLIFKNNDGAVTVVSTDEPLPVDIGDASLTTNDSTTHNKLDALTKPTDTQLTSDSLTHTKLDALTKPGDTQLTSDSLTHSKLDLLTKPTDTQLTSDSLTHTKLDALTKPGDTQLTSDSLTHSKLDLLTKPTDTQLTSDSLTHAKLDLLPKITDTHITLSVCASNINRVNFLATVTKTLILPANNNRAEVLFYNYSGSDMAVIFESLTPSYTAFIIPAGNTMTLPVKYAGNIYAFWVVASGGVSITELSI